MKKAFLLAVLTAVTVVTANAQTIQFGVKGGVNFANLDSEDFGNTQMRTSFHAGGLAEFMLADKFSLQPELLYSSEGVKSNNQAGPITQKLIRRLNYLNLPLLAKFYPVEGLSIQAGPQIGFLLSAEDEQDIDGLVTKNDSKEIYKNTNFGLGFGLGYKSSYGVFIEARYNLGLSNIDADENIDVKNNVIQVSLGFLF